MSVKRVGGGSCEWKDGKIFVAVNFLDVIYFVMLYFYFIIGNRHCANCVGTLSFAITTALDTNSYVQNHDTSPRCVYKFPGQTGGRPRLVSVHRHVNR